MQRPQGPGCSAWPIRPRLHVIAIGISQRCSGVGARSHPNIVLRDARGCEDIPATHSFQNALAVPRSTFCGSDPRTRSALHSKKEAPDSHEDVHFIPVKPGLLVPSASSEFGQQRALVRALVQIPVTQAGTTAPAMIRTVVAAKYSLARRLCSCVSRLYDRRTGISLRHKIMRLYLRQTP